MFMKTSVPDGYKFLILVWTILDSYFGRILSDNWKVYKNTDRICNSGKLYIGCAISYGDFHLMETFGGVSRKNQRQTERLIFHF